MSEAISYSMPGPVAPIALDDSETATRVNESRVRSFFAGVGLLSLCLALNVFPMSPYVGTVVTGVLGTAAVIAALWYKYNRRVEFTLEVAFFAGMTIQYLIAPMVVRVITLNYTVNFTTTMERQLAQDSYPPAMAMVLLFMGAYMVFAAGLPLSKIVRFNSGRLMTTFSQRSYLIFGLLAVQLWLVRAYMVASGTYYHSFRSRAQFDDPTISGLGQFAGGVGSLTVAFLWANILTRRRGYLIGVVYTVIDLGFNFMSGSRETTIVPLICIMMTYIIYRRRFPWKFLLLMLPVALLMIGFMDRYRQHVYKTASAVNRIDFSEIRRGINKAIYDTEKEGAFAETVLRGAARFDDMQSIARIHYGVPNEVDYLRGETFRLIPIGFIPRPLWPEKPSLIVSANRWFFTREYGSSPLTTVGEGYLNFGYPGVVLSALICAIAIQFSNRFMTSILYNTACIPVYVVAVAIVARIHTAALCSLLTTFPKLLLLALIVHLCTRRRRPAEAMSA